MSITVIDPMSSDLLPSPLLEHEHARGTMRSRARLEKWMESIMSAHNGGTSQHPLRAHVRGGPGDGWTVWSCSWRSGREKAQCAGWLWQLWPEPAQVAWMRPATNGDSSVNGSFVTRWNQVLESIPNKGAVESVWKLSFSGWSFGSVKIDVPI